MKLLLMEVERYPERYYDPGKKMFYARMKKVRYPGSVKLYRDTSTGITWVEDGSTGTGHSCHPNIHYSGSPTGMKKLGYWGADDRTVRSHGWIYNIDIYVATDDFDRLSARHCGCGGKHGS